MSSVAGYVSRQYTGVFTRSDEARVRKCGHRASLKRQGGTFPESARSTIHNDLLTEANFGY